MKVQDFFDPNTFTFTYVIFDEDTKAAILIDPVLDYNPVGSRTALENAYTVYDFIYQNELQIHFIL